MWMWMWMWMVMALGLAFGRVPLLNQVNALRFATGAFVSWPTVVTTGFDDV